MLSGALSVAELAGPVKWYSVSDRSQAALWLYSRHYSFSGRAHRRYGFTGPGEKPCLLTACGRAVFTWRKASFRQDGRSGVCCTVFRNEGAGLSSELIRSADLIADRVWPGEAHFTFVDATKVRRKRDPGRCFLRAGWVVVGTTKTGLIVLERAPCP